jgi:uncharacterized protein
MGARPGDVVGIIYGDVAAVEFKFAASEPHIKRLDYISAEHPGGIALGQVMEVSRHSQLTFDEAVKVGHGGPLVSGDHVSCLVRVIGYRDDRGLLQIPRTPFKAGTEVRFATSQLIQKVMGLTVDRNEGAYIGHLKGTDIPVVLDVNTLVQKHVSILAKTGAGKSYTVGVLLEELLLRKVPIVIIDPHGEYSTLANPNIEGHEIDNMRRFGIKPKSFQKHVTEYTLERMAGGRVRLALEGEGLEARELVDMMPSKLSSAQVGLLYQAVNELKKAKPLFQFADIIDELAKSPSNAKWAVISSLETLEATNLFAAEGTPVGELVKPAHATILNLKGTPPDIQEIAVARLARVLFSARKSGKVPPFMFVVEEAHNFCPERGISNALSGPELRTIASEGRKFGMGLLIVSQRPAKVDKNVLSQCNTQIIMKVTNPNDLKAISASVEGITSEAADEVQRLGTGVSLVAGGSLVAPVMVEVRTRMTRHGGRSVNVLVRDEDAEGDEPAPRERFLPVPQATIEDEPEASPIDVVGPAAEEEPATVAWEVAVDEEAVPTDWQVPEDEEPEEEEDEPGPWLVDGFPSLIPNAEPPIREVDGEAAPAGPLGESQRLVRFLEEGVLAPRSAVEPVPPAHAEGDPKEVEDERAPRLRPNDEPEDVVVHRVLGRLAHLSLRSSREAVQRVKQMAHAIPTLSPDEYVRRFAHVGRNYCYPSMPECGPCPLLDSCRLGQERLARGEVRKGRWGNRRR